MTHAYDEALLERASDSLGRMLDYSVHSLHLEADGVMELFCASGLAALFERGDIRTIAGMSGIELAYETLERSGLGFERVTPRHTRSLSAEYWYGCSLALAQWESGLPFTSVLGAFSSQRFAAEYGRQRIAFLDGLPLDISEPERAHQARSFGKMFAEDAAAACVSALISGGPDGAGDTPLKKARIKSGLSQSRLAKACGIPVRTIQQYEQRQKDLSRARAVYLIALSRVLSCDPASLLE